jgi:cytochrome c oxidase assembly factor CtaG
MRAPHWESGEAAPLEGNACMLSIAARALPGEGWRPFHDYIPPGTEWWEAWHIEPEVLIPIGLAVFLYVRGLTRWQERSREHPWWKTACYLAGIALVLIALQTPLDSLSLHHFAFHMVQHELIMMVAVPLILLGAPTTPTLLGLPPWMRRGFVRPVARNRGARVLYRFVTSPVIGILGLTLVLWAWHLMPGWYDSVFDNEFRHDLMHLSMSGAAVLFWWNVIDPKPLRSRIPHLARIIYLVAGTIPKMFLSAILVFAADPLYAHYIGTRKFISLTVIEDQQLGGLIMWVPSTMMMLVAAGIVFAVWARRDTAEQERREAEADAAAAAAAQPDAARSSR